MTRRNQKGSTMIEVALLAPVVAALVAGFVGVSLTFVRTMQVDQLTRKASEMAAGGADFDQESVRTQVYGLYGGKALQDRQAVLYVTHLVRDGNGYRKDKSFEMGRVNRWRSTADDSPETVVRLEPGEAAWVAEIWFDNDSVLSSVTPAELHARSVR